MRLISKKNEAIREEKAEEVKIKIVFKFLFFFLYIINYNA